MKGDVIIVEEYHRRAAREIVRRLIGPIQAKPARYTITVAGESGSGKSETGKAIQEALGEVGIRAIVLGQDDYFVLPPKSNDARRRSDPEWLGPHVEVRLDLLEQNLIDAINGEASLTKPVTDYHQDTVVTESLSLEGVQVIIAEGTYTSLLRNVDTRIFIARDRLATLEHRKKRNRGGEAWDPFIEQVLRTEHKIIAGHKQLADIVISREYEVVFVD